MRRPPLILALLAACGRGEERSLPPGVVRLALEPAPGVERGEIEALARWDDLSQVDWDITGAQVAHDGRRMLLTLDADEALITLPGPFDPARLSRLFVRLRCPATVVVRAALFDAAGAVAREPGVSVVPGNGVGSAHFDLPLLKRGEAPITRVELALRADEPIALHEVILVHVPRSHYLPPGPEPGLASIGTDGRRAVALCAGQPRTARFTPGPGQELVLDCGTPEETRLPGERGVLVVTLRTEDGASERHTLPLEAQLAERARWHHLRLPLDAFAGTPVDAAFELEGGAEALCALGVPALVRTAADAPTVVLVTSDTHRADHLGLAPRSVGVRTPFLDALAARGTYFTDASSSINNTNPSHAALFTGRPPRDTGIVSNGVRLSDAAPTLAEHFRDAGYRTVAAVSAVHLGDLWCGLGQGFDRYSAPEETSRDSSETLAQCASWLPELEGSPLFVWLHVFDAHGPYEEHAELAGLYYPADRDPYEASAPGAQPALAPRWDEAIADPAYTEALYKGEVSYLDGQLGRLLGTGRMRGALVAFTADHGETLRRGAHPFSHRDLAPATLDVPLILAGPAVPRGLRVERPVEHIDVGRTLLDSSGLADVAFPGSSLLAPDSAAGDRPRYALQGQGLGASVQVGRLFLTMVLRLRPEEASEAERLHRVRLFDVEVDPVLEHDLAPAEPERTARMRRMLVDWLVAARAGSWASNARVDSGEVERELSALGYTGGAETSSDRWYDPECTCANCAPFR